MMVTGAPVALMEKADGRLDSAVTHLRKMKAPAGERAFAYWITLGDTLLDLGRRAESRRGPYQ